MAHSDPGFALGLMQRENAPVRYQLPGPASLRDLRARMEQIGELIAIDYPVDPAEHAAYRLWCRTVRQQRTQLGRERRLQAALSEPTGAMHGGDAKGERFVPPVARGTGRTKRWAMS